MKTSTPLVVANWKMNPLTESAATRLFLDIKKGVRNVRDVSVVVIPPSVYLPALQKARGNTKRVSLGAQHIFWEKAGAHTGEVSAPMVAQYGAEYTIVGHSERRAMGMTDEEVSTTVRAALKHRLTPIVCVGEKERDSHGNHLSFVERELRTAFSGVSKSELKKMVVAYEPIWAIGTGDTATPHDVHEMKLFIQKVLADLYTRNTAEAVRMLYGGSVNAKNASELATESEMDGFLVGGASLKPDEFSKIVSLTKAHGR